MWMLDEKTLFGEYEFSAEAIAKGGLVNVFGSTLYALKTVIENNGWHENQNVFDHTVKVVKSLQDLITPVGMGKIELDSNMIVHFLDTVIDPRKTKAYHRRQLLLLAGVVHDIGKKDAFRITDSGSTIIQTTCQTHEFIGASLLRQSQSIPIMLKLSKREMDYVIAITEYHGLAHDLVSLGIEKNFPKTIIRKWLRELLCKATLNGADDMIMFVLADMIGSDLALLKPEVYKNRHTYIIDLLKTGDRIAE